ncbi:hypothetical protein DXG01_016691, partial [Tephrocybe rancida]
HVEQQPPNAGTTHRPLPAETPPLPATHHHVTRKTPLPAHRHVTRETPLLPAMSPNGIPTVGTAHCHVTRVVAVLVDSGVSFF